MKRCMHLLIALVGLLALAVPMLTSTQIGQAQEATPVPVALPQSLLVGVDSIPAGEVVNLNGIDIHYRIIGEGEPLLLLHGGLANGTYWANQIPDFSANYQLIVMDSRGHGASSFDETPISYAAMANDVLALLDHLSIEKASIVGWSDGGIIGLELALTHPERLNKVVAFGANYDPSGVRPDIVENSDFNAYIEAAAADYATTSPQPERWDEFLANIGNMWATEPNWTLDQLATITTPFLILDGGSEEAIDLGHAQQMAAAIPGAEFILMPGTGHFAMFEAPELFNQIVLDYLAR